MAYTPVPYDPELEDGLAQFVAMVERVPLTPDTIQENRRIFAGLIPPMQTIVGASPVEWEDRVVPGTPGHPDVTVTIIRPKGGPRPGAPGIYEIHGGGMILGNRLFGIDGLIAQVVEYGAVGVSIEYRLAPEDPAPAGAEDCYSGFVWMAEHADELGIDPERILVSGFSAGGGFSASVALLARDRRGPRAAAHYLGAPMLDDRNDTVSARQCDGIGAWDRHNNDTAWDALLGQRRFTDAVLPLEAPARAHDLANLPPLYIDVGAAETFRDEAVDFASRVWATGGQAELHVWAGGYHGFATSAPEAIVSRAARAAKDSWIRRVLNL